MRDGEGKVYAFSVLHRRECFRKRFDTTDFFQRHSYGVSGTELGETEIQNSRHASHANHGFFLSGEKFWAGHLTGLLFIN